jgi:uncharacterized protein YxjI
MNHQFRVERKILKLIGSTIRTFGMDGQQLLRAEQKGFKLKEQINFFLDDGMTQPSFGIKARKVLDISATYDITDANGQAIGYMTRKGLSSVFVRDEWECYNAQGQLVANVREDSSLFGFLRRFIDLVSLVFPQKYVVEVNGESLALFQQNYNILAAKFQCDVDDRLVQLIGWQYVYAIPNMLAIIENKQ